MNTTNVIQCLVEGTRCMYAGFLANKRNNCTQPWEQFDNARMWYDKAIVGMHETKMPKAKIDAIKRFALRPKMDTGEQFANGKV